MAVTHSTHTHVWRPVPNFPGYKVSTRGLVAAKRHRNGAPAKDWRVLNPAPNKNGYPQVHLVGPAGKRWVEVHRLVWEVFMGPVPPGMVVRHANDPDPMNNELGNLAVGTQGENCRDKERHGTAQKGEKHPRAKLTEAQVAEAKMKRSAGATIRSLAKEHGVHQSSSPGSGASAPFFAFAIIVSTISGTPSLGEYATSHRVADTTLASFRRNSLTIFALHPAS